MASLKRIAVLTHRNDTFEGGRYFLSLLSECWKAAGLDVIVLRGTEQYVPADALILHVDLTVTPEEYVAFAQRYPTVINGRVLDISKRRISNYILGPESAYGGPVIVKTDLNCGGKHERNMERGAPLHKLADKILRKFTWQRTGNLSTAEYRIYSDLRSVSQSIWNNPRLVVEKFLPEREGGDYCSRHWLFFGDKEYSYRVFSPEPIVKAGNAVRSECGLPVPEALRAMRAKLGFDYGKFDYTLVDGEPILFDANRTPTVASKAIARGKSLAEELKDGLYSLCDSPVKSSS